MKNYRFTMLLSLAAMVLLSASPAFARGQNKELYVVPVPGAVTIDGSLDDWDISGMVTNFVIPETIETQSARIAMMYDEEALYIGGLVRDNSPMMNRHDPLTTPSKAWDADVTQIFFSLNPDEKAPKYFSHIAANREGAPVATMLLWYFTDRELPSLAMFRGMRFVTSLRPDIHESGLITPGNYSAAYKKGEDGRSYAFEYRIPWNTFPLTRKPVANDRLVATMASFWSNSDGTKVAGGHAWAYNIMAKPGFPWQATDCWGTLIFSPEGNLPRELVEGPQQPKKPLPLTFSYSLPRDGETTVQIFDEKNRSVRILVPQQYRQQGDNIERWDGLDDQGRVLPAGKYAVRALVHDPLKIEYLFSAHNSGNPPYKTEDNRGGWGGDHGNPQTALAVKGGVVLSWDISEYGSGSILVDLKGQRQWGSRYNAEHLASDGTRLFVAGGHSFSKIDGVNVINLKDSRPLNFQPGMPALIPPAGGTPASDAVTGLTCDGKRIFVSHGKRHRIAVYDLEGKLLAQWPLPNAARSAVLPDGSLAVISGKEVARVLEGEATTLIAGPLEDARSIAVSPEGEIFVAQAGQVQQVNVFDAKGKFLRAIGKEGGRPAMGLYDPNGIYMPGGITIDELGRLWVAETIDGPKRISVWDSKTGVFVREFFGASSYFASGAIDPARPDELYTHWTLWKIDWKTKQVTPYSTPWRATEPNMPSAPLGNGWHDYARLVTATDGKQYMWGAAGNSVLLQRQGDIFKPFLRVSNGKIWQDRNNDQKIQPEEEMPLQRNGKNISGRDLAYVAKDLSLRLSSGVRLPVKGFNEHGVPFYDTADLQDSPAFGLGSRFLYEDDEGNIYSYNDSGMNGTFKKYSPDGQLLWQYTNIIRWNLALGLPISGPGRLWGMTGYLGVAGDYLAHMSYYNPVHFFTRDGIYIGALLDDYRLAPSGAYVGQPEGQRGTLVMMNIDGKERYIMVQGGQDTRVFEILGLDTVQRVPESEYEHTEEAAATAKKALEDWTNAIQQHAGLIIARGREALEGAGAVGKKLDETRGFQARMAYDETNLYVRYEVTSPNGLVNGTPEDNLIFRGGNCLDLQIATDPIADAQRKKPAPGDVRLLVTRKGEQHFAMIYRPKVAGHVGDPQIVFQSPTGNEPFDRIEQTELVGLEYEKTETGFIAVITVPLTLLGWQPRAGETVRIDVGYIFGNAQGTSTAARAYWKNNGFSANVVSDIPNESRLEPAEWGTAHIE